MVLGETEITFFADNDVIQHSEVDRTGGFCEGAGKLFVLRGRGGITTGMIMDEDETGRT